MWTNKAYNIYRYTNIAERSRHNLTLYYQYYEEETIYFFVKEFNQCQYLWICGQLACVRTLGSDDLIIFKCFRVIFSLKRKTIQYLLSFNLYFLQKRAPKLSICLLPTKRSV